jgi:hypothetical protein
VILRRKAGNAGRMEDVPDLYAESDDAARFVMCLCFDGRSYQLLAGVRLRAKIVTGNIASTGVFSRG